MEKRAIIKSTGIISMATCLSRVLGFIRDIVIAQLFGTGMFAQAFVVAFRIPNMLRDLAGEGATNAAFVPVLTEYKMTKSDAEYWHLARVLLNVLIVSLSVITILGIIASPLIVRLIAPGFIKEPDKLEITIMLNRVIFPYILLIGLSAYSMGVLNSLRHFTTPAFGSSLMNISMILSALFFCPRIGVMGLAIGALIGGAMQLGLQLPVLYKKGLRIKKDFVLFHPEARRILFLLLPRLMGTAVYELNIFIDTMLGSLSWIVGMGGVAALYYSNRLLQLPLAIFGIALAQVTLPTMSAYSAKKDMEGVKRTLSFSLRVIFLIVIPAAAGLIVLGRPIIKILLERGAFDSYSTSITYSALLFYSFGLFAYAGVKILVNGFYAINDTLTPVKTAAKALAINTVLNLILMWPLKIGGLALATSIAGTFNFFFLLSLLQKKIGALDMEAIRDTFIRVLLASLVMGLAGYALLRTSYFDFDGGGRLLCTLKLFILIGINICIFIVSAVALKVREMKEAFRWVSTLKQR